MKRSKFPTFLWLFASCISPLAAAEQTQKIILVLGSGGSRGLAHVGAIEELEKMGIKPDAIVGCSSGAVVGALYAEHGDIAKVKEILINLRQDSLIDFSFFQKYAISTTDKFEKFLKKNLTAKKFSDLQIPFVAVVTDLHKGAPVYLQEGDLRSALLASAALPALFPPCEIGDKVYVDGGVCDPLPVNFALKWKKGIVIASDISPSLDGFDAKNLPQVVRKSLEVAYQRLAYLSQQNADILLKMDFTDIDSPIDDSINLQLYERGIETVKAQSEKIRQKIFNP